MRHVTKEALLAGAAIIRKGDEPDPVSIVTKALDDLTKSVDERLKKLETKGEPDKKPDNKKDEIDVKAMADRLAELEKKANRPGGSGTGAADQQVEAERKALASYVRTGSDLEIKQAVSSSDPDGGYFILPTVDYTIRNLLKDISPLRQLAEVVSISGNTYERFYSTAGTGAQWVGETDQRPQDTARPSLIKHSYGVMEMYAAPAGSRQLFEDASIDIASWFTTWAVNDFAVTEGTSFLLGDGVGGKPRGLATYPIVATADATRSWGEMQYLPAGHASAPTDENWAKALIKTVLTLHPKYRPGAAWLMNNNTLMEADMNRTSAALNRALASTSTEVGKFGRTFGIAFGSAIALRGAQQLIDASTRITNALKVAGLSGKELDEVYGALFQSAQKNAAPLEALVQLYGRASLVQKELGVSTKELISFTDNVALALRVSGQSAQESPRPTRSVERPARHVRARVSERRAATRAPRRQLARPHRR